MFKQILAQAANGFSVKDLPFFLLQLSVSAILVWIIRIYWKKNEIPEEESRFLDVLIPVQVILTSIAVFSLRSPWILVLFGLLALIPALGNAGLSLRSRVFYLLCVFTAFGCATNLALTVLILLFFILPFLFFNQPRKK